MNKLLLQWHDITILQICWDEIAHKDKAKLGIKVVSDLSALWDYCSLVQRLSRLNHSSPWKGSLGAQGGCSVKSGLTPADFVCRLCGLGLVQL